MLREVHKTGMSNGSVNTLHLSCFLSRENILNICMNKKSFLSCKKDMPHRFSFVYAQSEFFDIQAYHRDLLEQLSPPVGPIIRYSPPLPVYSPPLPVHNPIVKSPVKKSNRRRGDRRSGQKRHRKVVAGSRDSNAFF